MNLLEVNHLRVAFGDKEVVSDTSFSVAAGEKLALVGESGSGKSVSAMSLVQLTPDASVTGTALFTGRDLLALSKRELQDIRGRDIAVIFQEPMTALNPLHRIGDQVAEVLQIKMGMDRRTAIQEAIACLAETGIAEPERRSRSYPHQLSGGQRQRAMIAMALACKPKLLLADEPTTALDAALRLQILELLDRLQRKNGMAVLMITHDLNLVRRFADRVAIMEHGRLVEQGAVKDIFANPAQPYTRKLLNSRPERRVLEVSPDAPRDEKLRAQHLRVTYRVARQPGLKGWWSHNEFAALKDASFTLAQGQTLGVIGESGSGKSTLAKTVLGLVAHGGALQLDGQALGRRLGDGGARKALARKIQAVFQDPYSSLSPRMTIRQIVGEGLAFHEPGLSREESRRRIQATLASVGLDEAHFPNILNRFPHEFSGGQRQRIAIARALIIEPDVLVLDEPTSALDVTIQKQVLTLLQELQKTRGLSYLLITHDMEVIRAMAHQVLVLKEGDIVEAGPVQQVLHAPKHAYTRELLHAAGYQEGATTKKHSDPDRGSMLPQAQALNAC